MWGGGKEKEGGEKGKEKRRTTLCDFHDSAAALCNYLTCLFDFFKMNGVA